MDMKKEYDITNAERGKFYNQNAVLSVPIYLDSDIQDFISELSKKKKTTVQILVNSLLKKNISLIKSIQ
jgi:hypothetical protein